MITRWVGVLRAAHPEPPDESIVTPLAFGPLVAFVGHLSGYTADTGG